MGGSEKKTGVKREIADKMILFLEYGLKK